MHVQWSYLPNDIANGLKQNVIEMEDATLDTTAKDFWPDKGVDTLQQGNLLTSLKDEASWPVN